MSSVGGPPRSGPPLFHPSPLSKSGPRSERSGSSALRPDEGRVQQEQERVNEQVNRIQDQLKSIEQQGDASVQHIKDSYEKQNAAESTRQETAYESQKRKGYERLRDLKRSQAAELSRVKREGDDELQKLREYYRNSIYNTRKNSDEDLQNLRAQKEREMEFEANSGRASEDEVKQEQTQELARLQNEKNTRLTALDQSAHQEYDRRKAQTDEEIARTTKNLDQQFRRAKEAHEKILERFENQAYEDLKKTTLDTSRKLAAYSERQEDPFYQLLDLQAHFKDEGDHYVLTARIPEYEQKGVSVAVHGNELVISGTRHNKEKVELEPGHEKSTSSYQTFMESFPFSQAVDKNRLQQEFHGDQLIVTLPKRTLVADYRPYRPQPKRLEVQRPHFPKNLPHVGEDEASVSGEDPGTRTSGPLIEE